MRRTVSGLAMLGIIWPASERVNQGDVDLRRAPELGSRRSNLKRKPWISGTGPRRSGAPPASHVAFATPGGLSTTQGQGAYDLESILIHELGHWFGLDHSAVWRAVMFPYAPPPGQFLGSRPTAQVPDGPLSDDDRTGIRALYPDAADSVYVASIRGRLLPANPFALATIARSSPGKFVTGIVGGHVLAVDADTGSVVAGALSGWSCDAANPPLQFDGSFDIERLPAGHTYILYAEPLDGLVAPSDFGVALGALCPQNGRVGLHAATRQCKFQPAHSAEQSISPVVCAFARTGKTERTPD